MPRISSPRPLDLTKPFVTSSQAYGAQPFDLSQNLVTWYRDIQGDFVPDLSGRGNNARCAGSGSHDRVTGSNDTPEYNPLNYPIKSFDLSDDPTSTSNVQHIKTVNSLGVTSALDDHTFTDNLGDVPLSISFWIKLDSTAATQYIAAKGLVASNAEWSIHIDNTNRITFRLNSQGSASNYIESRKTSAFTGTHSGWDYFVLTYDGSETSAGIKIYRNGSDVGTPNSLGSYSGMQNTNYAVCIGSFFSNSNYTPSASDVRGKIYSFAIWKNRALSSSEISALYNAYLNGPGGEARSGFISKSTRLQLRELDDHPGSYPSVLRTGDATRAGNLRANFNDETGIVFSESGNAVFPTMLPKGSSFSSQAVDIIGQESDISASLPIRSFQQPTHLHYSPVEEMGPFNENRLIPATDFFLSGTDPDVLPGFTSPVRSKIKIEIDITPQSDTLVMRNVDRRTVSEGGASIGDQTGFLYYNFTRKEWEQIGLLDPATGTSIYYDHAINASFSNQSLMSGTFPMQFGASWQASSRYTAEERNQTGYRKIGSPTIAMGAPFKTKYHATTSQCLRMSDYIRAPFLLEKVSVEFRSVNAQRIQGDAPYNASFGGLDFPEALGGASRDIDNYVFFAYKQNRTSRPRDSLGDVSGSQRSIIFSGSMTFWNSPSFYNEAPGEAALYHSPAFSYDFNLPYDSTRRVGSFSGSISMEITPSVANRQDFAMTLAYSTRAPFGVNNLTGFGTGIRNFWPGGTSALVTSESWSTPSVEVVASPVGLFSNTTFEQSSPYLDSRASKFYGKDTDDTPNSVAYSGLTNQNDPSAVSPYLLCPDDEIVFGLDAGVTPFKGATTYSSITGSFIRIKEGPCKVVLYGSMISESKEFSSGLNQNLSSDSVHEIIGAEPVLDQFTIEPRSSYYGSYLDDIVTGSMATPVLGGIIFTTSGQDDSRRVVTRVSLGQAGITGSLQRFVKMSDESERTYDSCLPDIFTFISQSNIGLTGSIARVGQSVFNDSLNEYTKFLPQQFPFKDNPTRFFEPEGDLQSIDSNSTTASDQVLSYRTLSDAATGGGLGAGSASDARMRDLVFRTGWKISKRLAGNGGLAHRMENQTSAGASQRPFNSGTFRYGISSVEPEFTSSRWRYDHYGYFRDMLEPRRNIVTYDGLKTVKISFVSGSTNVDPMLTRTQNLSTFATSSMPYFDDGIARNRPDNPDESLVEVIA